MEFTDDSKVPFCVRLNTRAMRLALAQFLSSEERLLTSGLNDAQYEREIRRIESVVNKMSLTDMLVLATQTVRRASLMLVEKL